MWRRRAESTFLFPTYLGRLKETLLAGKLSTRDVQKYRHMFHLKTAEGKLSTISIITWVIIEKFLR